MVPQERLQGEERAGLSLLSTSAEHNSAPQILPEQFGKEEGTQIQKNAFLKTVHADGQLLQSENHEERIPSLMKSQSYCMNAVISTGPNSSTMTSAQACWQHLTRSQHSPWEGD